MLFRSSRGSLLEFGYASNRTFHREIPQGGGLYILSPLGKSGNYFADVTIDASRDQAIVNWVLPSFKDHRIKLGADLDRVGYSQDIRRNGYANYIDAITPLRIVEFAGDGRVRRSNLEASAYIQDEWRVWRNLQLTYGLRSDYDTLIGDASLSPRAGFAWNPRGLEHTRVSGGFAVARDATNLRLFSRAYDQYALATYFTPAAGAADPALSVYTLATSRFHAPVYRNFSLGVDQRLPASIEARVALIRKRGRRGLAYQSILPSTADFARFGAANFDAIYGLSSFRRDAYDAVEFTIRQSIRRQYEWMASYTRARAHTTAVLDLSLDDPILAEASGVVNNNTGRASWDAPNRLIGWGYLPLPFKNWAISHLIEYHTGFPFSIVNEHGRLVGQPNGTHYPDFLEVNLHLERRFVYRGHRWAYRGGFNNITGHHNYNVVNNVMGSPLFGQFFGGQSRSFNFRVRWLGKIS